jgi:hypothetical protein
MMQATRYAVTIQKQEPIKVGSLNDCFEVLNRAYSLLEDQYGDSLDWEIHDSQLGRRCELEMAGGIWEACCEDVQAFVMYLDVVGWEIPDQEEEHKRRLFAQYCDSRHDWSGILHALGEMQKADPGDWKTTVNELMEAMELHDAGLFPSDWWPAED